MSEAEKKPVSNAVKATVLAVFLILGFIGISQAGGDESSSSGGASEGEAWTACKQAVREGVRNPATVDFSIMSTTIDKETSGGYDIAGSLTADNDFGVEQQIAFSCKVDAAGSATASLARSN